MNPRPRLCATIISGRSLPASPSPCALRGRRTHMEDVMGDKGKGKDKGKIKKAPKAVKTGLRPHEQRQQQDALKKPE